MDIERTPWPLKDSAYEYVLLKHVLEHVGAEFAGFKRVMQELYRVTAPEGVIEIHVPHFRHDTWWSDPTHVRAFTPLTFTMMSRKQCDKWIAAKANYTMLAYLMEVDFEIEQATQVYDPAWWARVEKGELAPEQIRSLAATQWGVVKELQVRLKAIKG
jgi:hypothetical protein